MDFVEHFGPLRKGGASRVVLRTPEFDRVAALPRRSWQDAPSTAELVKALNKYLHTNPQPCAELDTCEGCKMVGGLRPAQAAAIQATYENPGAFLPVRPGGGKTAVSLLAFTVVRSARPLLIVPADLVDKTWIAKKELARHWRVLPYIEIVSYQWLTHKNQAEFLNEYKPDVIFADECDVLGNTGNIAWKRIKGYLKGNPQTRFVAASGTVMGRATREVSHLLLATLRDGAPIMRDLNEQIALGLAIDAKVTGERVDPGALLTLPGAEGDTDLEKGRRAFRTRLSETPGVISTADDVPQMPLIVRSIEPAIPSVLRDAILTMRETWETPAGDPFNYALEEWSHARRMGLGFHYYYDPPPPFEWKFARTEWLTWARAKLGRMQKIDQLSQLQDEVLAGEIDDEGRYRRWLSVRDSYDPNKHRKTHWVDNETSIGWARDWMAKQPNGLIWTPDRAWGERASKALGLPYFAELGKDAEGNPIEHYTGKFAICSIKSCGRGRNLQRWSRNLVMNPPSVGKIWTQLLMRTWRDGQTAATVECDIILTSRESYSSVIQALRDSRFAADAQGGAQPLVLAELHLPSVEELANRTDDLWKEVELGV